MDTANTVCGANLLDAGAARCPACGGPGKRVKLETVKSLLKDGYLPDEWADYCLCLSKDCDVVYFGRQVFYRDDVKVKVWFKENDPSVPVCYCRDVTTADIIEHVAVRKCCQDTKDIMEHTGANTGGECVTKNPAGA